MHKALLFLLAFITVIFSFQCKKEIGPLNITLYDKPLFIIQSFIIGKWKLEYVQGGIAVMKYPARNNTYMTLKPNHITIRNDSLGIVADTTIIWEKGMSIQGSPTFFLSYHRYGTYTYPKYVVEQIFNDTLVLSDNSYDGFGYFYSRVK